MTVFRTLTGDLERILGATPYAAMAYIETNVAAPDALVDLDNHKVYPPGGDRIPLAPDGTFSIQVIDTGGVGTNVLGGTLRWTVRVNYKDPQGNPRSWMCRNFRVTTNLDLADATQTADPPAHVASEYLMQMQALLDQAEEAVGIDNTDEAMAYNVDHGPLTKAALSAAISAKTTPIAASVTTERNRAMAAEQLIREQIAANPPNDFVWLSQWVLAAIANAEGLYPSTYPNTYP